MEECNTKNAENHMFRLNRQLGLKEELTKNNKYYLKEHVSDRLGKIKNAYYTEVGQAPQPHSQPIRELVIVGMNTEAQVQQYCAELRRTLKVDYLSWAVHLDEGHEDPKTHEWIPNEHAHIIIDLTVWDHDPQPVVKKKHGRCVKDEKGDVIIEMKDRYGRTRHITKDQLAWMQDIAAAITGLERGVSSTQKHIQSQRFKAMKLQEDIDWLSQKQEETQAAIEGLNRQREGIEEENVKAEKALKNAHVQLRSIAKILISTLDSDVAKMNEVIGPGMAQKLRLQRDGLSELVSIEPEPEKAPKAGLVSALAILIAGVIRTLMELFESAIQKLKKQLAELQKQEQNQSLRNSAKSTLAALLDKPANEQAKQLSNENQALREANATLIAQNNELLTEHKTDQRELSFLRSQASAREGLEGRFRDVVIANSNMVKAIDMFASDLQLKVRPDEIIRLEYLGIPTLLGQKKWETIKTKVNHSQAPKVPGTSKKGGLKK